MKCPWIRRAIKKLAMVVQYGKQPKSQIHSFILQELFHQHIIHLYQNMESAFTDDFIADVATTYKWSFQNIRCWYMFDPFGVKIVVIWSKFPWWSWFLGGQFKICQYWLRCCCTNIRSALKQQWTYFTNGVHWICSASFISSKVLNPFRYNIDSTSVISIQWIIMNVWGWSDVKCEKLGYLFIELLFQACMSLIDTKERSWLHYHLRI